MNNKNTDNLMKLLKKEEEIGIKINRLSNLKNKIQRKVELLEIVKSELDQIKIKRISKIVGAFLYINDVEDNF